MNKQAEKTTARLEGLTIGKAFGPRLFVVSACLAAGSFPAEDAQEAER